MECALPLHSLVPRVVVGDEREPGIHCLHMRLITMKFHGFRIPPCNMCVKMTSMSLLFATRVSLFERLNTYSLQHLGFKAMTLKPLQRASVRYVYRERTFSCGCPLVLGKSLCYEVLPFVFDVMQCSATLHRRTVEVHQVLLRCSLQAS